MYLLLLIAVALRCFTLTRTQHLEQGLHLEEHQWRVLLDQMELLQKEHVLYRQQLETMEERLKAFENRLLGVEKLKQESKTTKQWISKLDPNERKLNITENRIDFRDLPVDNFPKTPDLVQAVKPETESHNLTVFAQLGSIHPLSGIVKTKQESKKEVRVGESKTSPLRRLAFSAYLSHIIHGLGTEQAIVFDKVDYNEGEGYDNIIGVFFCRVSGTYSFFASILSFGAEELHTEIVLDGSNTAGIDSDSRDGPHNSHSSNMAIFRCLAGQRVWVRLSGNRGTQVYGNEKRWTKFSGMLLWSDE
ncbi:hypothetical protein ACJMK2_011249 [Sinanodonta woodiana]|uniref:C1q domain-containing protein n=1 Tax=Sinanodonta woodiana TaxID=1069815 RepID=A0ABD3V7E1_SINWO